LTGIKVFIDTGTQALKELFIDRCPQCFGTGRMTCRRCKGSKTLRSWPERLVIDSYGEPLLLHKADDVNNCWECGELSPIDFDLATEDVNDDMLSLRIMQNFRAAQAGSLLPYDFNPSAGCVLCSLCRGSRTVRRFTPNWGKLFGFEPDIWTKVRAATENMLRAPQGTDCTQHGWDVVGLSSV
jgi:hypothetical protein